MIRLGLVAAEFNREIVDPMIKAVVDDCKERSVDMHSVVRVPGCYELPIAAESMLSAHGCAGVVVLGYIEKGETLHGEVMGHVVHRALIDMGLKLHKPIGIGIIGPGATLAQAQIRKIDYARAALAACLSQLSVLEQIRSSFID
jgi:6,7-dimethyl-8-ribityllumazine synthase